jgi:hypothetical protein
MIAQNAIIDIISFDEHAQKKVRRVKVHRMADNGDGTVAVIGVNMQCENPLRYNLPMHPAATIERKPNAAYWRPFVDRGEGEE